tara:strand:- start:661 stop:1005 length:345 start_codon:yes stop_codon:yes gene_type:complete
MNVSGYNRITINGLNFYTKTEGLVLLESIEKILICRKNSLMEKKHKLKILLDSQPYSVLSHAFMLYAHHLENTSIQLTEGERGTTEQMMQLIAEICLEKAKHRIWLLPQGGWSQ